MTIHEDARQASSRDEGRAIEAIARLSGRLEFEALAAIADAHSKGTEKVQRAAESASIESAKEFAENLISLFDFIPWDGSLIERNQFEQAYQATLMLTDSFKDVSEENLVATMLECPPSLVVLRTITGYTYDQLESACKEASGTTTPKERIKLLEGMAYKPANFPTDRQASDIAALASAIYRAVTRSLLKPIPNVESAGFLDRQAKVDTDAGWRGVHRAATEGVTYSDLLYERYLGRPFAYVQDALSERKGDLLENAIAQVFTASHVPYYRTKMRERIPGFEQAPDFLIPNKDSPECVVESKLTEDGGTARDKAARIFRLSETCRKREITLVAFVDGRGFTRINDVLAPIMRWTGGWTFCLNTAARMLEVPAIARHARG